MVVSDVAAQEKKAAEKIRRKIVVRKARQAFRSAAKRTKFTGEKPSLLLYLGVSMIALFKDMLDLVGIGSLPAIGTVITICLTFLIWILLLLFDRSGGGKKTNRMIARGLLLIFVGLVEGIAFGLNFLPIETAAVIVLYLLAKRVYKKAKKEHNDKVEEEAKKNNAPYAYA